MDSEKCVLCGAMIPEGRQVCPICEKKEELRNAGKYKWLDSQYFHKTCDSNLLDKCRDCFGASFNDCIVCNERERIMKEDK